MRRMMSIQPHVTSLVRMHIEQHNLVLPLQQLDFLLPQNVWYRLQGALVRRLRKVCSVQGNFSARLEQAGGGGLENWVEPVSDELVEIAFATAQTRQILYWTGSRQRRLETKVFARPQTRKIRRSGDVVCAGRGRAEDRH